MRATLLETVREITRLFHPRRDAWEKDFQWDDNLPVGSLTADIEMGIWPHKNPPNAAKTVIEVFDA